LAPLDGLVVGVEELEHAVAPRAVRSPTVTIETLRQ
jgi:hypothetical protein